MRILGAAGSLFFFAAATLTAQHDHGKALAPPEIRHDLRGTRKCKANKPGQIRNYVIIVTAVSGRAKTHKLPPDERSYRV